jgi:hypothetical protein
MMGCTKWFKSHHWTKWETIEEGHIMSNKKRVGKWFIQKRICPVCGREQRQLDEVR